VDKAENFALTEAGRRVPRAEALGIYRADHPQSKMLKGEATFQLNLALISIN
jgi:hypothetical protein